MTRRLRLAGAFVPALAFAAQSAAVSGRWEVRANIGGTASDMTCTFTQKEAELTGTCEGERGALPVTGKVEGKTATWAFKTEYEGQTLTVIYSGTLESAEKLAGTVDVQPLNVSGDFTATKAK